MTLARYLVAIPFGLLAVASLMLAMDSYFEDYGMFWVFVEMFSAYLFTSIFLTIVSEAG